MKKMEQANDFLDKKNIFAIIGVSANPNKGGFKICHTENNACYADLKSLPKKV